MMPDKSVPNETASQIDTVAADWVARLDRGVLSPEDDRALDAWLAGDPRRAGAFARARAVAMLSEKAQALGPNYNPDAFVEAEFAPGELTSRVLHRQKTRALSRRQLLWGSAAAGITAVAAGGYALTAQGKIYETQRGEMKVVPLSDGSVISLNTESRVRVLYSAARRTIHLDQGEAMFDVAKDRTRPFVVHAGDMQVVAIGTSFIVQKLADLPVHVLVREGVVEIGGGRASPRPLRLGACMQTAAPVSAVSDAAQAPNAATLATPETGAASEQVSVVSVPPAAVERAVAWREGRIAFEGETLLQAVAAFRRYSDTRIVIDDPSIANEEITGLFQVNDPVTFAKAVASSFGLQADVSEKQVRLHRVAHR